MRRQLRNDTGESLAVFKPLAQPLVRGFVGRSLRLILDPTDLAADLTIVHLAYRGRALPSAWMSVYIKPHTVKEALRLLFAEVQQCLPHGVRYKRFSS